MPLLVITENMEIIIPKTLFEHPKGQITEANITTSSLVLGATNSITFSFKPTTELPNSQGLI
jgi:hypothetical protein